VIGLNSIGLGSLVYVNEFTSDANDKFMGKLNIMGMPTINLRGNFSLETNIFHFLVVSYPIFFENVVVSIFPCLCIHFCET
jgi:hypothetical protein